MDNESPLINEKDLLLYFRKTGDPATLGLIFTPYSRMVLGVCLKYLRDREDSKDAVMQIFEKLLTLLRSHDVGNFKSWLYVTTRNHCLMQLRARKSRKQEDISAVFMENELFVHPEEEPELEGNLVKLENCIDELAGDQRECVRHFYIQEKCYKEISAITGFDMNKVKSHIQNGKRNLKLCMERNG